MPARLAIIAIAKFDLLPRLHCRDFSFAYAKNATTLEAQPMPRILVIDDEPDIRTLLDDVLKSAGYEVILAANGREGVMRHRSSPVDLLITDLYVPNLEGLEIIREFRSHFPEVAIIAMSGTTAAATMLSVAQTLGAIGILHKPFLPAELIAAVEKALGGKAPAQ